MLQGKTTFEIITPRKRKLVIIQRLPLGNDNFVAKTLFNKLVINKTLYIIIIYGKYLEIHLYFVKFFLFYRKPRLERVTSSTKELPCYGNSRLKLAKTVGSSRARSGSWNNVIMAGSLFLHCSLILIIQDENDNTNDI